MTDELGWLSPRQRDGGIDRIPLPPAVPGQLWLSGKHAIAPLLGFGPGTNHNTTLGWSRVVCLTERHELVERYPDYVRWLDQAGEQSLWWPIPDMHAPTFDAMLPFVDDLAMRIRRGDSLLVHCGAGIGRAGTTAVCVLIRLGMDAGTAEQTVAANRPMAGPEVGAQRDLVSAFQRHADI